MWSKIILPLIGVLLLLSCGGKDDSSAETSETKKSQNAINYLSMKINGKEWTADSEIFAAFHPGGYDNAILIAGSKGPKDKNEQVFNMDLYKTTGPGIYQFENGNAANNVIQLAGLSEEHFMYGSMMGFKVKVNITKASKNPTIIEATFEGELTGNASDKLVITEGKFYYHE
jgi:hypothetical protein